jgi:hypothetical protein
VCPVLFFSPRTELTFLHPSLDASQFHPSRSQRQVLQRFNAFVQHGEREGQPGWGPPVVDKGGEDIKMDEPAKGKKDKGKGKANQGGSEDWGELVKAAEWEKSLKDKPFKHRFEVRFTFALSPFPV